jgi:hypothetical protein
MTFPKMFRVMQELEGPTLRDVPAAVREALRGLHLQDKVRSGQAIALTAGSRGIANIAVIIRTVVEEMRALGLEPFIVPAMGSHGGATAEGQTRILSHYGVSEATAGCPVKSSMEVVQIAAVNGMPVFCDRHAWEADHIGVIGRVKPHTDFEGETESGLLKMMAVGLGKQQGAAHYHRAGHHHGYASVFRIVGQAVLDSGHILFGLAMVENGHEQTARIQAALPCDLGVTEERLLVDAKAWLARLPFDEIDLLIVDELGKDISGAGMDPNVTGRPSVQKPAGKPRVRRLFVRDLTEASEGNATGVGYADLTTLRLVRKINYSSMHMNVITAGVPEAARVPMALENDRDAIRVALGMIGLTPPEGARVVRIQNTLHLTEFECSEALLAEVLVHPRLEAVARPLPMTFDGEGNLTRLGPA